MNAEDLKKKALRIVTTPPEVVYALSRHWFVIVLCLGIGTAFTLAKAATDSPVYGATARLLVKEEGAAVAGPKGRDADGKRFLRSQVEILRSDSVLRTLVRDLGADQVIVQDEDVTKPGEGQVIGAIRAVRRELRDAIGSLRFFDPQDVGEELNVQKAIRSLRRRSFISPDGRTGMIKFRLYGHRREYLEEELATWIDAYFHRMNELAKETYDSFYASRTEYWKALEAEDRRRVLEFRRDHPNVSEEQLKALTEELVQLRVLHSELTRRLDTADLGAFPVVSPEEDPKLAALRERKLRLELDLSEARAIYREDSQSIQVLKDKISELGREIEAIGAPPSGADLPEDRKEELSRQIARVSEQLREKTTALARLKVEYEELEDLERRYRTAKEYRETYSLARKRSPDFADSDRSVRVTIVDPPSAGTQPVNSSPVGHVLFGSAGGILCGILIALFLEIFTRRIRLRNDVESDLGLPVVGVIEKT